MDVNRYCEKQEEFIKTLFEKETVACPICAEGVLEGQCGGKPPLTWWSYQCNKCGRRFQSTPNIIVE